VNKNVLIIGGVVVAVIGFFVLAGRQKGPRQVVNAADVPRQQQAKELYEQATKVRNRKPVEAKGMYREIIEKYPDIENIAEIQRDLHSLNMEIILSNRPVEGKTVIHDVVPGDTLGKIASKYGVTVGFIKRSNDIKGDVIRVGQKLRIWRGDFNVFVDKSQNILILKDGSESIKIYNVATGENNSTPVGEFKIVSRLIDPVWFNRGVVVPPESPQNELGSRWLGFDLPGYGIHGTIKPETIGQQATAGCVRMLNTDVEELYDFLTMDAKVVIVD
jgi:lipoprotein-anchoring transpeptidase ErfK/SrfK